MAKQVELLASYWSLAGGATPQSDREYSVFSFNDRVAAAARVGFKGFGIWHADLEHTLRTQSLQDMRRVLDDHGIVHVELEFLHDWWFTEGERKAGSDARRRLLFDAATVLRARHIKVGDFADTPCPMSQLIDTFASLCTDAAGRGINIAFELMPFANVKTLPSALEMVTGANANNGGIIIDLWHVVKIGIPYAEVARIPARFLSGIEINDGLLKTSYDLHTETINHRQLCGEGEFDVRGFVTIMLNAGYQGPWGIEVLNAKIREWPLDQLAQRVFSTTHAQFPA